VAEISIEVLNNRCAASVALTGGRSSGTRSTRRTSTSAADRSVSRVDPWATALTVPTLRGSGAAFQPGAQHLGVNQPSQVRRAPL
jgi:hypothetical protein